MYHVGGRNHVPRLERMRSSRPCAAATHLSMHAKVTICCISDPDGAGRCSTAAAAKLTTTRLKRSTFPYRNLFWHLLSEQNAAYDFLQISAYLWCSKCAWRVKTLLTSGDSSGKFSYCKYDGSPSFQCSSEASSLRSDAQSSGGWTRAELLGAEK